MFTANFSKISIVQSLHIGDMRTGRRLREEMKDSKLINNQILEIEIFDITNSGRFPVLHIECHGSKAGIVLADRSTVTWAELKPALININVATRCNLLVILGACYGGYLGEVMQPVDRAPFWGMIGPTAEVFPEELLFGFKAFYSRFFASLSGDESLEALLSFQLRQGGYTFTSAGGFFKTVYAGYLANYCTPGELDKRAKRMSRSIKKSGALSRPSKGALKRTLRRTEESYYRKYYEKFFMVDLYPENAKRFDVPFSEVKELRETILADRSSRNWLLKPVL
jgi:hypothetical protein